MSASRSGRGLRPQDALFVHDATPLVARQLGAVLLLDEQPAQVGLTRLGEHIAARIGERAVVLPMLSSRLHAPAGHWPCWVRVTELDPVEHLTARAVADWPEAVHEFFSAGVPTGAPPWQLALIRDTTNGRTAVLAKMHHALGDGLAMTETLVQLLTDEAAGAPRRAGRPHRDRKPGLRHTLARAGAVLRGLASLAPVGLTPVAAPDRVRTTQRRYAGLELPADRVRALSRQRGVSTSTVLVTAVAQALHRLLPTRGDAAGLGAAQELRAMVPRSTRVARTGAEGGNWTAAVSLSLPVGPMSPLQRLTEIDARLAALDRGGQPAAITAVLSTLGRLPTAAQSRLIGMISGQQFFDLIVSVMPGTRRAQHIAGARVAAVLPILPLGRAGLAVGLMNWGDVVGIGITTDPGLLDDADELAGWLRVAFEELRTSDAERPASRPTDPAPRRPRRAG